MLLSETRLDHWEGLAVSSQNSLFESAFPLGQTAESGLVSLSQEHIEKLLKSWLWKHWASHRPNLTVWQITVVHKCTEFRFASSYQLTLQGKVQICSEWFETIMKAPSCLLSWGATDFAAAVVMCPNLFRSMQTFPNFGNKSSWLNWS